jgi:type I restriction enzyme M protein
MNQLGFAIKTKLDEAYITAYQSKQLLEIAKTGVEKAIEKNEEVAITWINEQIEVLGISL